MCCSAATSGDICGEFKLANIRNGSIAETNENTHTPQLKNRNDVESQISSIKETSLHNPELLRNSSEKNKTTSKQVLCLINSQNCQNEIQETTDDITAAM